jgi:hypothetical protein
MNLLESDLTSIEIETLLKCCAEAPGETYMEIGVYAGGTLNRIMMEYNFHNYIGVDLFEDFKKSLDNTHIDETFSVEQIAAVLPQKPGLKLLKMDSRELLTEFPYGFSGLVFIDGNHTYNATLIDFLNAHMLLQYGFICIHNASNTMHPDLNYVEADGGPYKVVEFAKKLRDLEYIGTFDRLAVFRK